MLETYKVGVTLELGGNVQNGIDKLITQVEALDRQVKGAADTFAKLARDIGALGMAGRSIQSLNRAMDKLGSGGGKGLADMERMASAAKSMTAASERLTGVLRENARLTADIAKASEAAARAAATGGRGGGGPGGRSGGGHRSGGGFGSHDLMLAGMGASMIGEPLLRGGETAMDRGLAMAGWRAALLSDTRLTDKQADAAINAAYAAATTAPGTTPLGNAASFAKLKTITGDFDEATAMLPKYAQLMSLLQTIDRRNEHGHGGDQGYAAAKAAEILGMMTEDVTNPQTGQTRQVFKPEMLNTAVDRFGRIASATLGTVEPTDILGMAKQATTAGMVMSPEFMWEKLPALMQVWGGSRTGTALQSLLQVFGPGGKMEAKTFDNLARLGLADPEGHKRWRELDPLTGKMKTKESVDPTKILNYDLLAGVNADPAEWAHKASLAMEKAGIHGTADQALNIMSGAQRSTIARLFADLIKDYSPILKEQENIRAQRSNLPEYYAQNDPSAKVTQMQAAFDKLVTTLGSAAAGDAARILDAATGSLNRLSAWAEKNPGMSRILVDTAAGLGSVATALGTLSTAIFLFGPALKALGVVSGGGAAGAAAGGGGLGLASRVLMGTAGLGLGAGALAVGGALALGNSVDPQEAEKSLERINKALRPQSSTSLQTYDGIGADGMPLSQGRPQTFHGDVYLDSTKVGRVIGNSIARSGSGPSTGTTGFDIKQGVVGGLRAMP